MKKSIFTVLFVCFCMSGSYLCASSSSLLKQLERLQHEIIEANESKNEGKKKLRQTIIQTNIDYLEKSALKKIKKLNTHLQECKENATFCEKEEDSQYWLKKVNAAEKKLKELNEIIFSIEVLKMRMAS